MLISFNLIPALHTKLLLLSILIGLCYKFFSASVSSGKAVSSLCYICNSRQDLYENNSLILI